MDLIEPISFILGVISGIVACYSVSDLVFSKGINYESDEV